MLTRVERLESEIPAAHREIAVYAKHVMQALEQFEDNHRKYVAAQGMAGVKPEKGQEHTFYETVRQMRENVLTTLEQTIDDLKHKGDKRHEKHFTDGLE